MYQSYYQEKNKYYNIFKGTVPNDIIEVVSVLRDKIVEKLNIVYLGNWT